MPVEFGIWRIDEGVVPVPSSSLDNEAKLEDILEDDLSILGLDVLLLLGRQVITALGKRIDLLAMDVNGDVYAIELKRGRTPSEVGHGDSSASAVSTWPELMMSAPSPNAACRAV